MKTLRLWLCALLAAAPTLAGTGDESAHANLRKGAAAFAEKDAAGAFKAWEEARTLADHRYLSLEAAARQIDCGAAGSAATESARNQMMTYWDHTPPLFVTDLTRRKLAQAIGWRTDTGAYPEQKPDLGVRSLNFAAGPDNPGFVGRRFFWMVPMRRIPGPPATTRIEERNPAGDGTVEVLLQNDEDKLPERRLDLVGGGWGVVDPYHAATHNLDEKASEARQRPWRFDRCLLGYSLEPLHQVTDGRNNQFWVPTEPWYEGQTSIWKLRYRLFYQSEDLVGGDYSKTAEMMLDALLRAYWLGWEYFGRQATDDLGRPQVLDVWLTPSVMAGEEEALGECFGRNLYVYRCAAKMPPLEWLRTAFHEYSHVMMPKIGRYTTSRFYEPSMEGFLGERLMVEALHTMLTGTEDALPPWLAALKDSDWYELYRRNECEPLLKHYLQVGPRSAELDDTGDAGANWLMGFGLWLSAAHGPKQLRELWWQYGVDGPEGTRRSVMLRARGLRDGYTEWLGEQTRIDWRPTVPLRVTSDTQPKLVDGRLALDEDTRASFWLFVPPDRWQLRLVGPGGKLAGRLGEIARLLTVDPDRHALMLDGQRNGWWEELTLGGLGSENALLERISLEKPGAKPKPSPAPTAAGPGPVPSLKKLPGAQ